MSIVQTEVAAGRSGQAMPPYSGGVVAQRFVFPITAAGLDLSDIIEMCAIPPNCVPVEFILDTDDLDTNATETMTLDVGLMSGDFGDAVSSRTCGAEIFSASVLGQDGGVARPTLASAYRIAPSDVARSIGIKIHAAAATDAAGDIGLTVFFAAV